MVDLSTVKDALSKGVDVLEKLGFLESLAQKLVNHPDKAAAKLTEVLNNVAKTYEGLENAFIELRSLSFRDAEAHRSALKLLDKMRGPQLGTRMMESRASCSMIGTIYFRYLDGWFNSVLSPKEQQEIQSVFLELQSADADWVGMLQEMVPALREKSKEIAKHLGKENYDEAGLVLREFLAEFDGEMERLSDGLIKIYRVRANFFKVSKAMVVGDGDA